MARTFVNAYRCLTNGHAHNDGKTYNKGDIVFSEFDLVTGFPNKFKKVVVRSGDKEIIDEEDIVNMPQEELKEKPSKIPEFDEEGDVNEVETEDEEESQDEEDEPEEEESENDIGNEVTKDFPKARRAGLRVFKKGFNFTLTNLTDYDPINEEPLRSRKQVEAAIDDR